MGCGFWNFSARALFPFFWLGSRWGTRVHVDVFHMRRFLFSTNAPE
jgi:hypothetical protein